MSKRILAIDPGNMESAYTIYQDGNIFRTDKIPNYDLIHRVRRFEYDVMAIEMIASYGMPVGKTVFETCLWIGRFIQLAVDRDILVRKVYRKDVKMFLCSSMRAKDGNIRQAIIDRYPATGGGRTPQVGVKSNPGPLFGVSSDMWASLGVAITFDETNCGEPV